MQAALPIQHVESIGVDYLTCSFRRGYSERMWESLTDSLLVAERNRDNFIRRWSSMGYEGFKCGQAQMGTRQDGALIRVSGSLAASEWRTLVQYADNVSRIDCQVTVRDVEEPAIRIGKHHKWAKSAKRKRGRGPTITFLRSDTSGCTLYIGKRTSNVFGRIYDKGAESKDPHFAKCVRYEVEFKEKRARQVSLSLLRSTLVQETIAAQCYNYLWEKGVRPPTHMAPVNPEILLVAPEPSRTLSDVARNLIWLRTQVRPTVERLIAAGHLKMVQDALGMCDVAGPPTIEGE